MPANPQPITQVPGQALPTALQPLNVALAEIAKQLTKLAESSNRAAAQAGAAAGKFGTLGEHLQKSGAMAAVAFNQMSELIGKIGSQIGTYVGMYNPASLTRFRLAADDALAALGRALVPALDRFTVLIRGIGDGIASLGPTGRALVAGLVSAAVGVGVLATATIALNAALNSATFGIPALIGAVTGGLAGMAFVMKDLTAVQDVVNKVMAFGTKAFQQLAAAAGQVLTAVGPAVEKVFGELASAFGGAGGVVEQFAAAVVQMAQQLAPVIEGMAPVLGSLAKTLASLGAALMGYNLSIITGVAGVFAALAPALESLAQLGASLIGAVLAPLKAVFAALGPLVRVVLTPLLVPLRVAAGLVEVLAGALSALADTFATVADGVTSVLGPVLDGLSGLFAAAIKPVTDGFNDLFGVFKDAFEDVRHALRPLQSAFADLRDALGQVFRGLAVLGRELFAAMKPAVEVVKPFIELIADSFVSAIRRAADLIKGIAEFIRDVFGLDPYAGEKGPFKPGQSQGMAVKNAQFTSVDELQKRAIQNAYQMGNPGKDTMESLAKAANARLEAIETVIKNLPKDIANAIIMNLPAAPEGAKDFSRSTAGSGMFGLGGLAMDRIYGAMVTGK